MILFFLSACSDKKYVIEGTFENIEDKSRTIIKKINESEYEILAAFDRSLHFRAHRNGNILSGYFQGQSVKTEFNKTYDTITNTSSGKTMFIGVRVSE